MLDDCLLAAAEQKSESSDGSTRCIQVRTSWEVSLSGFLIATQIQIIDFHSVLANLSTIEAAFLAHCC